MLIYMATNKVNGKRYVGATSRGLAVYQDKALEFYGEFARAA